MVGHRYPSPGRLQIHDPRPKAVSSLDLYGKFSRLVGFRQVFFPSRGGLRVGPVDIAGPGRPMRVTR